MRINDFILEPVQLFISDPDFLAIGEGPDTRFTSVCSSCGERVNQISPLFRLLDIHFEEFRNAYEERFSKCYGFRDLPGTTGFEP